MIDRPSPIKPPLQAGPAHRVLHALMAFAGWALFVYWWWIVFHRVTRHEMRFTVLFIAASLVFIVLVTLAWAWHNLRIFKRRGPRTRVRQTIADFSRDGVGRPVTFLGDGPDRLTAPVIYVRVTDDGKRYDPAASLPPRVTGPRGFQPPGPGGRKA